MGERAGAIAADRLTRSQRTALLVALRRDPTAVFTSNHNGSTYIATASADVLVRLGLMERAGDSLQPHLNRRVYLTNTGRALAHGIENEALRG